MTSLCKLLANFQSNRIAKIFERKAAEIEMKRNQRETEIETEEEQIKWRTKSCSKKKEKDRGRKGGGGGGERHEWYSFNIVNMSILGIIYWQKSIAHHKQQQQP